MIQEKPRLLIQRVHRHYLIKEAEHFRDHKKGLPEWLKNSDDSYTRHEEFNKKDFSDLPILINIDKKDIFCLDFGGANAKDMIEQYVISNRKKQILVLSNCGYGMCKLQRRI